MPNILDEIVAHKRIEIAEQKQRISLAQLEKKIPNSDNKQSFKQGLIQSKTGIIAEFKRRSPSRGWLFEQARVEEIVPSYSVNGAAAISVLTDSHFFGGTLADLEAARSITQAPLLRKDFIVDQYQLYQAKLAGANAILLIASVLSIQETKTLATKANELGLDVLLEIHNEQEIGHINQYVDVVGVNNRNLSTFVTDVQLSFDLADKIPKELLKISESGISLPQTVIELQQAGYQGFLMGECFMKTNNPGKALADFIAQLQ